MSDKKIIIRNCPATYLNFESKYVCTTQIKQKGFPFYCQDCTDCVLKQIVELARSNTGTCANCEAEPPCDNICDTYRLNKILQLLDIQEVE